MSRQLLASLPVGKLRVDLSSTNLDTSNWVELSSSLPSSCSAISVMYTGIGILKLAKGAAASEVELPLYLTPGMVMEKLIPLNLAKAIRLSAKCVDQAVTSGELVINLFG
jgi:hypothetical protein